MTTAVSHKWPLRWALACATTWRCLTLKRGVRNQAGHSGWWGRGVGRDGRNTAGVIAVCSRGRRCRRSGPRGSLFAGDAAVLGLVFGAFGLWSVSRRPAGDHSLSLQAPMAAVHPNPPGAECRRGTAGVGDEQAAVGENYTSGPSGQAVRPPGTRRRGSGPPSTYAQRGAIGRAVYGCEAGPSTSRTGPVPPAAR